MFIRIYIHFFLNSHTRVWLCVPRVCASRVCARSRARSSAHTHTYIYIGIASYSFIYIHVYMLIRIYIYAYAHTLSLSHTHIEIPTYSSIYILYICSYIFISSFFNESAHTGDVCVCVYMCMHSMCAYVHYSQLYM